MLQVEEVCVGDWEAASSERSTRGSRQQHDGISMLMEMSLPLNEKSSRFTI